jgi:hypothetical protein
VLYIDLDIDTLEVEFGRKTSEVIVVKISIVNTVSVNFVPILQKKLRHEKITCNSIDDPFLVFQQTHKINLPVYIDHWKFQDDINDLLAYAYLLSRFVVVQIGEHFLNQNSDKWQED